MLRPFMIFFTALMLTIVAVSPAWNYATPGQRQLSVQQKKDGPINIPEKINYINQVRQTVESLNHSPHIMTIHHNENEKSHAIKREVTVKFVKNPDQTELDEIKQQINGKVKRQWDNYWIFKSKTKSKTDLINYFNGRDDVEFAEPNFLLLPNDFPTGLLPNDPLYTRYQWNLPMINMEKAWDISRGSEEVIIAVIDTGIDLKHQDFQGQLVKGYNVLTGQNDPMDDNGHGSHVAGIIAASTNNNLGIAGVSWNNKIMPIKAIGSEGTGTSFDIARGIRWAADHGAKVINMSVGNYHPSGILLDSIRYAHSKGIVLVAASGNDNSNQPSYPAAYPEVISVAAVDQQARRAEFSNYGGTVEIAAPGVDIPSAYLYNEYAALSGTSMACPHVAGLAGLILSVEPRLKNEQVRKIIQQSAQKVTGAGRDDEYGYGLIDVSKALQIASDPTDIEVEDDIVEPEAPTRTNSNRQPTWAERLLFKLRLSPLYGR
ncbi:hypothetical protein BEP19_00720 [Ammoniphilus oxalaticus]|uniref:Peptidase S8/S53 domain-containing protein n=1 Tax=Ammoniphilus oxalaticus TaxID=66863 RepID=A0A419SMN4_9BACL|nr:S8 family peptidase [Ammoniphilus oxalaticus]RKD25502.1 hypothetical protein BEP19_00720 [Ammoniphilus oxalaticus]